MAHPLLSQALGTISTVLWYRMVYNKDKQAMADLRVGSSALHTPNGGALSQLLWLWVDATQVANSPKA